MIDDKQHITVIGLGAMGRALAGAFLDAGHPTTVWNRSADKADELVARGARRAATITDDEQVPARAREAIAVLGEPVDVGRDAGLAALYDIALLSGLMGMTAGAHHAAVLVACAGGDVEAFKRTLLLRWMEAMLPFTAGTANAEGAVPDAFNPGMQAVSLEHMIAASEAAGGRAGPAAIAFTVVR